MSPSAIRVLLLGEHATASQLLQHLSQHDCVCSFAASPDEGITLFREQDFHLILSAGPIRDALRAASSLGRASCSVFCAYAVEESYWWLPLMKNGQSCVGTPALRPREFVDVLDQILEEIRKSFDGSPKRVKKTPKSLDPTGVRA